jgi:3-oxoadipate enol-lactonase
MPFAGTRDLRIHYRFDGPADAPVLVLSNSLGADLSAWDPQVPELAKKHRVLRYDSRGHGQTAVTPGPYTLETLAGDVVRLLDVLQVPRARFCGLSIGGQVGAWLGAHAGARFERLVLCNSGALIGNAETWNARIETVRAEGLAAITGPLMERWFTAAFRERSPQAVAGARAMVESTPAAGYVACCAAVRDADLRADLAAIQAPTLVISGRHDPATPPELGRALAAGIAGARHVELEAAHLSNVEAADAFTAALIAFLAA